MVSEIVSGDELIHYHSDYLQANGLVLLLQRLRQELEFEIDDRW